MISQKYIILHPFVKYFLNYFYIKILMNCKSVNWECGWVVYTINGINCPIF